MLVRTCTVGVYQALFPGHGGEANISTHANMIMKTHMPTHTPTHTHIHTHSHTCSPPQKAQSGQWLVGGLPALQWYHPHHPLLESPPR